MLKILPENVKYLWKKSTKRYKRLLVKAEMDHENKSRSFLQEK